jgi:hypothetical protein
LQFSYLLILIRNFLCLKFKAVKLFFHERFYQRCCVQRCQRCIGSNGRISTSVRCYFRSAAVKVMAMLTLKPQGPAYPRGWQRRFCAALLGGDRW